MRCRFLHPLPSLSHITDYGAARQETMRLHPFLLSYSLHWREDHCQADPDEAKRNDERGRAPWGKHIFLLSFIISLILLRV